mmetsp:Transcript_21859/g.36847  ORF Transcript_21859/g.36847 Transcript_21859/m.36847 type:complete len:271 (-) Transcript_21859:834-1646(-)
MTTEKHVDTSVAPPFNQSPVRLGSHLGHHARAHRLASLADGEAQAGGHGNWLDEIYVQSGIVPWHHHLHRLGQDDVTGHIGRAEEELGSVVSEEGRVAASLLLGQHVDLRLEVGVGAHGAGLRDQLSAADVISLHAAQQQPHVVARLAVVHALLEHLHARAGSLDGALGVPHDLHVVAGLDGASLNAPRGDGSSALDGEDVLHGHEEGLVHLSRGRQDLALHRLHQLHDRVPAQLLVAAGAGRQGRTAHDADVVTVELILAEQLSHFHLD